MNPFRPSASLVRSVAIPQVDALWVPGYSILVVSLVFEVTMDTTVRPFEDDLNMWIDGTPQALGHNPMNWGPSDRISFSAIGLGSKPTQVSVQLPDYNLSFRWIPGRLVDPFGPTVGIVHE